VRIDTRWGASEADRRRYAEELVALAPDVILASNSGATLALQAATSTVPIVFANVTDPVAAGFVDSLARPGGNATGFTLFEYGMSAKWLELLKEIAPLVTRAAVIREGSNPAGIGQFAAIQSVAPSNGVQVHHRARQQRDRARRWHLSAFPKQRLDRDGEWIAGK
jgi:putative tryptophan/tyrosine transport system substrate-binding protein